MLKKKIGWIEVIVIIVLALIVAKGWNYWSKPEEPSKITPIIPEMVFIDYKTAFKSKTSFYIGKYEVTNAEYVKFLNDQDKIDENWITIDTGDPGNDIFNGLYGDTKEPSGIRVKDGYENRPVVYVSWYGSVAYCNWLTKREGLISCYKHKEVDINKNGYRLATEEEWVHAYGRGCQDYYWLDNPAEDYCWFEDNSEDTHHEIGQKKPNSCGLYDMSGNVQEWCSHRSKYSKENVHGILGGGFSEPLYFHGCHTHLSWRSMLGHYSDYRSKNTGFRLAKSYIPGK